jgi:hypothetical protein
MISFLLCDMKFLWRKYAELFSGFIWLWYIMIIVPGKFIKILLSGMFLIKIRRLLTNNI